MSSLSQTLLQESSGGLARESHRCSVTQLRAISGDPHGDKIPKGTTKSDTLFNWIVRLLSSGAYTTPASVQFISFALTQECPLDAHTDSMNVNSTAVHAPRKAFTVPLYVLSVFSCCT